MANTFRTILPLQVETRPSWTGGAWTVRPNVVPLSASIASEGVGQFSFSVDYGTVKFHGAADFAAVDYTQIQHEWVRVKVSPYGANDIIFQGRIESDSRTLYRKLAGIPEGKQIFTAYDGVQLLNKRLMSRTISRDEGSTDYRTIKHLIPFNLHQNGRDKVANRSDSRRNTGSINHYVFELRGDAWRVIDAIEYLLAEFMNGASDPQFALSLPVGALTDELEPLRFESPTTVMNAISQILSRQYGWSWAVVPTSTGYTMRLFTLTGTPITFESATVPANPNVTTFNTDDPDAQIQIERSFSQKYGKIRCWGNPMIVVASFNNATGQIAEGWTGSDETEFNAASADKKESGDFTNVFQRFHAKVTPVSTWSAAKLPSVKADGTLDQTIRGPVPQLNKATLSFLPLYQSVDYLAEEPGDPANPDDDFLPPRLFMKRTGGADYFDVAVAAGAAISVLPAHIGLLGNVTNPATFSGAADSEFDHATAVITVAFEASERLEVEYVIGGATNADGVFEYHVNDAELWYLAPDTLLGIEDDGSPKQTSTGYETRNDRTKIFRAMAGLIARYGNPRAKATLNFKGIHMYHSLLGYILQAVADGTDSSTIAAPITGVQWNFENQTTIVSTGHAV